MRKILVPLDGSPLAESVLPYAEEVARRTKAELLLLTVVDLTSTWGERPPKKSMAEEMILATAYLSAKGEELEAKGLKVRTKVAFGAVAEAILSNATRRGIVLIAMSTHGRTGISQWVLGSIADKVLHGTHLPLLLIRAAPAGAQAEGPPALRKILVAMDGSPLAESVLPFVTQFAKSLGASLVLFQAVAPLSVYPGPGTAQFFMGAPDILDDLEALAEQYLARTAEQVEGQGVKVERLVRLGFVVDEIVRTAGEVGADLIAIATHGRSGLGRWVIGSVANGVVHRTTLPCLVIRPEQTVPR